MVSDNCVYGGGRGLIGRFCAALNKSAGSPCITLQELSDACQALTACTHVQ